MTDNQNTAHMVFDVDKSILPLIKFADASPEIMARRNMVVMALQMTDRGSTDHGEEMYRKVHYHGAKLLVSLAAQVMDEAVKGGMDLRNNGDATQLLALAASLCCQVAIAQGPDQ